MAQEMAILKAGLEHSNDQVHSQSAVASKIYSEWRGVATGLQDMAAVALRDSVIDTVQRCGPGELEAAEESAVFERYSEVMTTALEN